MKFSRNLFWSRLDIEISEPVKTDVSELIEKCFQTVQTFEDTYSRFKKGNFLDMLNTHKSSEISSELLSILKLSLKVSQITGGYFDITLRPVLENAWYGVEEGKLEESVGYKNIVIDGNTVELKNGVSIDIWAVGKGYMVDAVYNMLDPHVESFVVNFWGDMRIKGRKKILLEDPYDETKAIGSIVLDGLSIAGSSPNKRRFWSGHHLINPKTKESQNDKIALYVTHRLASFADIFSTALFVSPLEKSLEILEKTKWLEALIVARDGSIYKSRGFDAKLNIS